MAPRYGQKVKILHLVDILKTYTDEEHPLNAAEICEKLAERGISAERKAIYDDVEQLIDFGYDVIKTRTPRVGFFLGARDLELPEIYLLADAVRSAKFITPKKTRELVGKLDGMLSVHEAHKREKNIFFDTADKCDNEELFRLIDGISTAINERKKIRFKYSVRTLSDSRQIVKRTREMTISPYAMTWQEDHYYVIGNYEKYDNLLHLRIDRMNKLEVLGEAIRPFSEVCEYKEQFDVSDYTKKLFSMYGGETDTVEMRCSKQILEQVIDRFSDKIFIRNITEDEFEFSVKAAISDGLVRWAISHGDSITVLKPESLRQRISAQAQTLLDRYR
ncbi:MAG: WYL domain-containing protein [Clostridia bacterium]|nr:WYL domain-containing protein [Clostridia bacterium]